MAAFFFKLERELEIVNTFYLQKENEFKVRLRTLNDKKRILLNKEKRSFVSSSSIFILTEAYQQFRQDLNKLHQFIEINATGFRKILKKWDKRSKSSTKELYLERQVEAAKFTSITQSGNAFIGSGDFFSRESDDVMNDDIETELFKAITIGSISTVKELLERIKQPSNIEENREILSRVFWRSCSEKCSNVEAVQYLVDTGLVNFTYIDDINDRSCLHESSIVGRLSLMRLCVVHGVNINSIDFFGRKPLHYVCMYGHHEAATYLLSKGADLESLDHDGFSPLIYAITNGHSECVEILLVKGAKIDSDIETDYSHIPLSLACQRGHKDITMLLLNKGAKIVSDVDGLTPLHLASREGHHELLSILTKHKALLDTLDNYNSWSPIFYAASEGHIECVDVLIKAGCEVNIFDEFHRSPIYYAAWEGHIECINKLHLAGAHVESIEFKDIVGMKDSDDKNKDKDSMDLLDDGIPSLSLPPPIIPLRIYGHNYLDKTFHIQVTLGHTSLKNKRPPVHLYGNSQLSSLKLIISSKPDLGRLPHSVILPLGDEREMFLFQVDSLENFSLDFDIFPTFGSKVIGKGVALPDMFDFTGYGYERHNHLVNGGTGGKCICPLFDTHLKVVGELSFEFAVVKPFSGVQLEIGGHVETYWKSTNTINVTRDMVAVVYSDWVLPITKFDLSVFNVTFQQFEGLKEKNIEDDFYSAKSTSELQRLVHQSFLSLEVVLEKLPSSIGVNLEIRYPTIYEMTRYWFSDLPDINSYVDTILQTVYDYAKKNISKDSINHRSVIFSSLNPAICTALNWKQPNYAVFFKSYCGYESESLDRQKNNNAEEENKIIPIRQIHELNIEQDKRCTSIKEAVKFAKSNNLLGVIFEATLLLRVPSLITNIKQSGLILTTFGSSNNEPRNIKIQERYGVDTMVIDGVVKHSNQ
ncbi:7032_t:CDS:2 [Entrophospora sp. SA101]|nr:7032_t:CDS:2 [Entrophospora sp. SA101]